PSFLKPPLPSPPSHFQKWRFPLSNTAACFYGHCALKSLFPRSRRPVFSQFALGGVPMVFRRRCLLPLLLALCAQPLLAETYTPPATPRQKLDFNTNWKFIKEDVKGSAAPAFDDSKWQTVST